MLQWLHNITPEILTSLSACLEGTCLLSSLEEWEHEGLNAEGLNAEGPIPRDAMAGQENGGCFITSATNHIC